MSIQQSIPGSSIAIVGMGQGGTSILKLFLQIQGARVKYVCETDPTTEGMLLGSKIGITCLTELKGSAIVTDRSLNLIFKATGKKDIFEYLQKEAATYCTVIGAVGARIIYYLLDGYADIFSEKAESILRKMEDRCILLSSSIQEMLELANLNLFLE